jgi:hypothetical protein
VELLAATGGRPAVELISAPDGEKLPLPLGLDESNAFDHALARDGWVAVEVGYQVVALRDGDLLRPARLPDAWRVLPAADPRLAVVDRFEGRSREPGEDATFQLVDRDGNTLRSVAAAVWGAVGESGRGLVTDDGLLGWNGSLEPLALESRPLALLGGRHVLFESRGAIRLVDLETASERACPQRPGGWQRTLLGPAYSAAATAVAFKQHHFGDVLVATVELGPRWLDVGFAQHSAVWLHEERLLVVGDKGRAVLDIRSGDLREAPGLPRKAYPRVAVTGRFDREQLRAALAPPWKGPMPPSRREELMRVATERVRAAAREIDDARQAIRLRSCLPPRRLPIGGSRLGGRPDLPRGHRWPAVENRPMAFLAQLRLDELAAALPEGGLPRAGLLVVFADIDPESQAPSAVHAEVVPTDELRRLGWPARLPEELRYDASLAVAEPTLTVANLPAPGPDHRLLGHPSMIQEHGPPAGHELLLQLDSDALTGMTFGDGGRLHVWCRTAAPWSGVLPCEIELDSY